MKGQGKRWTRSTACVSRLLLSESESERVQLMPMLIFDGIISIHPRISQARSFMDYEKRTGSRIRRDSRSTFSLTTVPPCIRCCASTSSFLSSLQACSHSPLVSRESHISNLQLPYLSSLTNHEYHYVYLSIYLHTYIYTIRSRVIFHLGFTV
jgi:hypothetical protein